MLRDGRLHLSGLARLVPLLTDENCEGLLKRATHLSKRQIEELVVDLAPRPDAPSVVRRLPVRRLPEERPALESVEVGRQLLESENELVPGRVHAERTAAAAPGPRTAAIEPLSPARYKVQFTASAGLRDKIERLMALMRSEVPDGDLAAIMERAVTEKLERLEARRFGVDEEGRPCSERHRLEFHHRRPYGMGGDHSPANMSLLCATHNRLLAEHDYGRTAIVRQPGPTTPSA